MNNQMEYTELVKVNCNWPSNVEGKDIKDCIITRFQQSELETGEIDILNLIEESNSNCVNFTKSENKNDLFININCHSRHLISKICVCSEAKIVELFGKAGEYVSMHPALFSENTNEFPMYSHLMHINRSECSLKFKQLENSDFVWIYGLIVYLTEIKEHLNTSLGPINIQNVQHLLNPELLARNASKLFSTLSLKESKLESNDFSNSVLNTFESSKSKESNKDSQFILNKLKQFEKSVDDKLNNMSFQLNSIKDNVETINKKFDTLLNTLHAKNIL